MKNLIFTGFLLFGFSAVASPAAKTAEKNEGFQLIHVADLEKAMAGQVYVFDANNETTRKKDGVIPGAKPLASVTHYDAAAVLPADKNAQVVFYCANTSCMASHEAAKVAVKAGYKNVNVMADGIEGWKKAGKKTDAYKGT